MAGVSYVTGSTFEQAPQPAGGSSTIKDVAQELHLGCHAVKEFEEYSLFP